MPREQINYPQPVETHYGSMDATGVTEQGVEVHAEPAIHISWNAAADPDSEGIVQLAFEADEDYFKTACKLAVDYPSERPHMYTPQLTRTEINKLIRVLKRARDQAYGRDE